MRTAIPVALIAVLALAGCAGQVISRFEAGNAVVEAERRQVVDFLTDKVCHIPISWLMEARNPNLGRAVIELCPDLKRFVQEMAAHQSAAVTLTTEQLERLLAATRAPPP